MVKSITFPAALWVFCLSFFCLQCVIHAVPRPLPSPPLLETRSVPAPPEVDADPIDLCPFGLIFNIDCNSCFCNNKTGIIGCTKKGCPIVDSPTFPWQSFVPKFSTSSGLTAAGRIARDDSSSAIAAGSVVRDPTIAVAAPAPVARVVKEPSVPRVPKDPSTTGRLVAEILE